MWQKCGKKIIINQFNLVNNRNDRVNEILFQVGMMIKNIPDPKDYYKSSLNYMNISWEMAFDVYKISKEVIEDEDEISEYREEQKYHLNTCLMLLSQSIELFLKFRIAEVNPLLMVNLRNKDINADFSELQSIDAKDLLPLHDQIRSDHLGSKLSKTFEEIRLKRNRIMHSAGSDLHEEEAILIQIIKLSHLLFNSHWLKLRLEYLGNSYFSDSYVDIYNANEEFSICKEYFASGNFKIYSGYLQKEFVIRCPYCDYHMDRTLETHTCLRLTPLTYRCIICDEKGKVLRNKCPDCSTQSLDDNSECLHCEL